jgi:hypothetical protein
LVTGHPRRGNIIYVACGISLGCADEITGGFDGKTTTNFTYIVVLEVECAPNLNHPLKLYFER